MMTDGASTHHHQLDGLLLLLRAREIPLMRTGGCHLGRGRGNDGGNKTLNH